MVSIGKTLRKKASGLLSPTTGQIPDHDDNMSGQRKQTQSLLDSYKELSQAVTGFQKVIDTLNRHHKVKISRSSDSNLNDFFATYDQALVSSRKAGLSTERTLKSIQQDLENSEAKLQLILNKFRQRDRKYTRVISLTRELQRQRSPDGDVLIIASANTAEEVLSPSSEERSTRPPATTTSCQQRARYERSKDRMAEAIHKFTHIADELAELCSSTLDPEAEALQQVVRKFIAAQQAYHHECLISISSLTPTRDTSMASPRRSNVTSRKGLVQLLNLRSPESPSVPALDLFDLPSPESQTTRSSRRSLKSIPEAEFVSESSCVTRDAQFHSLKLVSDTSSEGAESL